MRKLFTEEPYVLFNHNGEKTMAFILERRHSARANTDNETAIKARRGEDESASKNHGFNVGHTGGKICRICAHVCAADSKHCPICGNK